MNTALIIVFVVAVAFAIYKVVSARKNKGGYNPSREGRDNQK